MKRASVMVLVSFGLMASSWQGLQQGEFAGLAPPSSIAESALVAAALPPVSAAPESQAIDLAALIDQVDPTRVAIRELLEARHTTLSSRDLDQLTETIVEESARNGLDPWFVVAVMEVESRCYPLAVSPVGAMGLMQLKPATGEEVARREGIPWHGPETLFDPIANVKLGTAYLARLTERFGDFETALAAYNWGPGRIRGRLRSGATLPKIYIEQVQAAYDKTAQRLSLASS